MKDYFAKSVSWIFQNQIILLVLIFSLIILLRLPYANRAALGWTNQEELQTRISQVYDEY